MCEKFVVFPVYHPAERIERMTGISVPLQRTWRARKHLDVSAGPKASLDTLEACALAARAWAATLGLAPKDSRSLGAAASASLAYYAVLHGPATLRVRSDRDTRKAFIQDFIDTDQIARKVAGFDDGEHPAYAIGWIENEPFRLLKSEIDEDGFEHAIATRKINLLELGDYIAERAVHPLFEIEFQAD